MENITNGWCQGRLNWPQLDKLIWALSFKSDPLTKCSCHVTIPSPTLWAIWLYIARFRQRRNSTTAWTGGLGTWGRGGLSFLETEFYLQPILDCLWHAGQNRERRNWSPQNPIQSLSLPVFSKDDSKVTTFRHLIEQNFISFYYSYCSLQCTSWDTKTKKNGLPEERKGLRITPTHIELELTSIFCF